jgi:C-1 hydroxylase
MTKEEQNMRTVQQAIRALNDRDIERFLSHFTEDGTSHEVFFQDPLTLDEFRPFLEEWLNAYPDTHIDTRTMLAEGDAVVVENIVTGTFQNDLGEVKATGRSYTAREMVFFDMQNGKIKAERIYQDQKHIEEQLGIG